MRITKNWTMKEKMLAKKMRFSGKTEVEIAAALGRTRGMIQGFFRRQMLLSNKSKLVVYNPVVPPDAWEMRDRRANEYRTPAQILLGDPAPTQSALGRPCP